MARRLSSQWAKKHNVDIWGNPLGSKRVKHAQPKPIIKKPKRTVPKPTPVKHIKQQPVARKVKTPPIVKYAQNMIKEFNIYKDYKKSNPNLNLPEVPTPKQFDKWKKKHHPEMEKEHKVSLPSDRVISRMVLKQKLETIEPTTNETILFGEKAKTAYGIRKVKQGWQSELWQKGKMIRIEVFDTKADAILYVKDRKETYYGDTLKVQPQTSSLLKESEEYFYKKKKEEEDKKQEYIKKYGMLEGLVIHDIHKYHPKTSRKGSVYSKKDYDSGAVKLKEKPVDWFSRKQADTIAKEYADRGVDVALLPTYGVGDIWAVVPAIKVKTTPVVKTDDKVEDEVYIVDHKVKGQYKYAPLRDHTKTTGIGFSSSLYAPVKVFKTQYEAEEYAEKFKQERFEKDKQSMKILRERGHRNVGEPTQWVTRIRKVNQDDIDRMFR